MEKECNSSHDLGRNAEGVALRYLKKQGLKLLAKNYTPPGRGMADLDLVMQGKDGTVIFVEVKARKNAEYGGAAASVGISKQRRIIKSAQHFLIPFSIQPACRFDVVLLEGEKMEPTWIRGAFY